MGWHQFVGTTLLLYGLINPVGAVPIYSHLIRKTSSDQTHRILLIASLAIGCLLVVAALWGEPILTFFNVGLDDFRVAGGMLALVIAFEMFQAHYGGFLQTLEERAEADADLHGVAITPLSSPASGKSSSAGASGHPLRQPFDTLQRPSVHHINWCVAPLDFSSPIHKISSAAASADGVQFGPSATCGGQRRY
jgi:hypothetical protein